MFENKVLRSICGYVDMKSRTMRCTWHDAHKGGEAEFIQGFGRKARYKDSTRNT
jgi:hypothetical protein